MNRADEMVPKRETSQPQTNGVAAGSFDNLREQLHAVFNKFEDPRHQAKPVDDLHGSDHRLDEPLRTRLKNFQRPSPQPMPEEEDGPVERDDLRPGITSYPDHEASEREANFDLSIENKMTRRRSRGFSRYLVAILIGVAATLAWQSYGDVAKQIVATSAPELGSSPEAKQMIAKSIQQLGWTKLPVVESKEAPVAQTAPATPSIDPVQVQQMIQSVAALRESVQQLAAG